MSSNRVRVPRGARSGITTAPADAHHPAAGQPSQATTRARQTVAPSSIAAWFQVAARSSSGSSSSGVPRPSRSLIRTTLTSTAATRSPNANDATAAAVYGPIPGSARSPFAVCGQPSRATTAHASCNRTAREL